MELEHMTTRKILINDNYWQTRIAITQDQLLQNIHFSAHAEESLERSFFKGIVTKVLPGMQTAFVEIGQPRAGFLHISEIDRELAIEKISKHSSLIDDENKQKRIRPKLDISKILKEGDAILVQVSKEPVYEKGAKLTTCFTLPGRFIILMPNIPRIGISKRIESNEERSRLKILVQSALPEGMGAIIRTTCEGNSDNEILKDIKILVSVWQDIQKKFAAAQPHEKLYEDLPLALQVVRDYLSDDVEAVITDSKKSLDELSLFVKKTAPEYSHKIKLFQERTNIFDYYHIEKQIEHALEKKVELKSGGSLIIETTEAMTVIDVNTGRFIGKTNLEETILKTNLEAAQEIVRQLRLRNIGGLIVIDFIDMATGGNKQKLFKFFEKTLRELDKFQSVVLKISEFGLVQMTRKRSGKTLQQLLTETCASCKGIGVTKSLQTQAYAILRIIKQRLSSRSCGPAVTVQLHPLVFQFITSLQYNAVFELEKMFRSKLTLVSNSDLRISEYKIEKTQTA